MKKLSTFIISFVVLASLSIYIVHAQEPAGNTQNPSPAGSTQNIGISIPNPFGHGKTLYDLLKTIINEILMPIGGILAVLAFIFSGFLFVTAQGNEKKIEQARRALLYSAIGTALLLGAWTIANVIENTIHLIQS